jgi:hypothetical protein
MIWTLYSLVVDTILVGVDPTAPQLFVSASGPPISLPVACLALLGFLALPFVAGRLAARDTGLASSGVAAGVIVMITAMTASAALSAGRFGWPTPYQWIGGLTCPALVGGLVGGIGGRSGRRLYSGRPGPHSAFRRHDPSGEPQAHQDSRDLSEQIADPSMAIPDVPPTGPSSDQLMFPPSLPAPMYQPGPSVSPYAYPPALYDLPGDESADSPLGADPALLPDADAALPGEGSGVAAGETVLRPPET